MRRYIRKIIVWALMLSMINITGISVQAESAWPKGPAKKSITAASAIVMELNTGTILYKKNINEKHYPASITKIMTTLLCLENSSLSDTVEFSYNAVNSIEYGSSNIGIMAGEKMKMEDCLYGIMLMSANEVCNGVAEHVAGDIDSFVDMMNKKAEELGCKNTHFANANGLFLKNHYTTAYDMALISKEAMKNSTFRKITGTKNYTIPKTNKHENIPLYNKHNMLNPRLYPYGYDYCIGGKTGYTNVARYTLVTFAKKGDMELVCVVMKTAGPPNREPNEYTDTIKLLNFAFDKYSLYSMSNDESNKDIEGQYSLFTKYNKLFDTDDSPLYIQENAGLVLPNGIDISQAEKKVELYNDVHIQEGENLIGRITYTYADREAGSAGIYYNTQRLSDTNLNSNITEMVNEAEDEKNRTEAKKQEKEDEKKKGTSGVNIKLIIIIAAAAAVILAIAIVMLKRTVLRRRYIRMYSRRKMLSKYSEKNTGGRKRRGKRNRWR